MVSANFNLKQNNTVLGIHAHVTWDCNFVVVVIFFLLDSTKQYTLIYMCILRYIDYFKTDTYLNQYWWKYHSTNIFKLSSVITSTGWIF